MPYIKQDRRSHLDPHINRMCLAIKGLLTSENVFIKKEISNEEFLSICGDLNYCFSRILSNLLSDISYSKVAVTTGILENVKQEFYRRVAEKYEDEKISENGDIEGYK
jgi:hypothetical protein